MSVEGKRALIAAVRKIAFTGIILLVVWLVLLALRGAIPQSTIQEMNSGFLRQGKRLPYDSRSWNWSSSLWNDHTVSATIGRAIGKTLRLIGLSGLLSLVIAGILLLLGFLVSKITEHPVWLARLRSILRLILVSGGAAIPLFVFSTLLAIITSIHISTQNPGAPVLWASLCFAMLPAWLLVQTGQGIIAKQAGTNSGLPLVKHLGVSLLIRLLKLIGLIIVVVIVGEQLLIQPGLGRLLIQSANEMDFPVIFGIAWTFVIIVAPVKLIADLIEIAYNYFSRQIQSTQPIIKKSPVKTGIPKSWLILSLGLAGLITLVALVVPLLAPNGMNEIHLDGSFESTSAKYLLGTDQLGRDILSRTLWGIRIDVLSGVACAAVLAVIGTGWAMLAAYCRRMNNWVGDTLEDLVMLPGEIIGSCPWLVLLVLLISLWSGIGIVSVAFVCGLVMLPRVPGMLQEAYRFPPEGKSWLQSILWSIPVVFFFTIAIAYVNS